MGVDKEEGEERVIICQADKRTKSNIHISKTKFMDFQVFSSNQITHKDNSIENHREFLHN
jgi:hypothetical protein